MDKSICSPSALLSLEALEKFKESDNIRLKKAEIRNVIFVGRSRTGKSTVFKVLKKSTHIARFGSIFSQTKETCLNSFTVEFNEGESKSYTINIIDTPGLFEVRADNQARNNEIIKNTISTCLCNEITKIHAIFFVCSFDAGVNKHDIDAFVEFMEFFRGAEDHVAMLITRAEGFSNERKENLVREVASVLRLRNLPQGLGDRVFFTGALSEDMLEDGIGTVQKQIASVKTMRNSIFKWIFSFQKFCQLDNLNYFQLQVIKAAECLKEVEDFVNTLAPGVEKDQNALAQHKTRAKELYDKMNSFEAFISTKTDQNKMRNLLSHSVFPQPEKK